MTTEQNKDHEKNFFIYKNTKIPWAKIAAMQIVKEEKNSNGTKIITANVKLMNENGSVTIGDQNITIEGPENVIKELFSQWDEWVLRMQENTTNSGRSFFQSEEKVFEAKLDEIKKTIEQSLEHSIELSNEKLNKEISETARINQELSEKTKELDEKIKNVDNLFKNLSDFLSDLSSLEEQQKEISNQLMINDNIVIAPSD